MSRGGPRRATAHTDGPDLQAYLRRNNRRRVEAPYREALYGHGWGASAGSVTGTGGAGGHSMFVPVGPPSPPGLAHTTVGGDEGFQFTSRGVHMLSVSVKVHMPTAGYPDRGQATVSVAALGGAADGTLLTEQPYLPSSVDILTDSALSFTISACGPVRPFDALGLDQAYAVQASWLWVTSGDPGVDLPSMDAPHWITYRIDNPGAGT